MIAVLANPKRFDSASSTFVSKARTADESVSKSTLPLVITVRTLLKSRSSNTPRNLSFRMLGFVGAIPRRSAT